MKAYDVKINKSYLICCLVIIAFWIPPILNYITELKIILNIFKSISMLYILFVIIRNKKSISYMTFILVLFYGSFVFATFEVNGNLIKAITAVMPQLLFGIYADYMLRNKTTVFVESMSKILEVYIIINSFLLLIFPNGMGKYVSGYDYNRVDSRLGFLSLDNAYIKYFLVAIALFYFVYATKPLKRNMLFAIMLINMFFVWSGTGVTCLVFVIGYIFLIDKQKLSKVLNFYMSFFVGTAMFFGVIVFRITDRLAPFITMVLGKDITFTGRTILWNQAMLLIRKQSLFGYGVYDYELLVSSANGQSYSAHNTILQLMLMGGIVTLVIFIILILYSGVKLSKSRQNFGKAMLNVVILVMWISSLFENMVFDYQIYMLLLLACNYDSIAKIYSGRYVGQIKLKKDIVR